MVERRALPLFVPLARALPQPRLPHPPSRSRFDVVLCLMWSAAVRLSLSSSVCGRRAVFIVCMPVYLPVYLM